MSEHTRPTLADHMVTRLMAAYDGEITEPSSDTTGILLRIRGLIDATGAPTEEGRRVAAEIRGEQSGALHAGAETLTPLQHLAAVITVLSAELAHHPYINISAYTALYDHGPHVGVSMIRDRTGYAERAALLADLARVLDAEVALAPDEYGNAGVRADDWRGTGIAVSASMQVAEAAEGVSA